jgi:hypothetical protein
MSCIDPEVLSRWMDESLPVAESKVVRRHVSSCPGCRAKVEELRGAAQWIARAGEPGKACLSVDDMAAVLEGAEAPAHVRSCPRCAAEIAALRPKKRATRRLPIRRESTGTGWFAAAAALMLAVMGLVFLAQEKPAKSVSRAPEPAPEETPETPPVKPPSPPPAIRPGEPPSMPPPGRSESAPPQAPSAPESQPAKPEPRKEEPPAAPLPQAPVPASRTTSVEAPARRMLAFSVRGGAVSAFAEGKWTSALRIEEGMPLRADGKTSIEFARARLTFEGASRFTLGKDEVALAEGSLSLDVQQGSPLSLVLGACRIAPMANAGRVLLSAKPDRVVVDEGAARWQEIVLHQGVEHQVVKEKLEPQKRRTLAVAARPREVLTWRPDFKDAAVRSRIRGRIDASPEGTHVVSVPSEDKTYFESQAGFTAPDERGYFALKANTALRFRYFLSEPAFLQLVVNNGTKRENFNLDLDPAVRQWTTITINFKDIPVNQGGNRALKFDAGDRIWSIGWFVGKPGSTADLYVDQLEVVEIER